MTTVPASCKPNITLAQLLEQSGEIAALPQVVMRVIDLTVDPKATATDLERALGMDQALAARILTMANSAYYGLPRRIATLREAVVFLGFKGVRNLAMTITTFNLFLGKSDAQSLARRTLWRHSLDTAQCARVIAGRLHPSDRAAFSADEAFTCGLLHDIGKMAMDRGLPELFAETTAQAASAGRRFHEVEMERLPFGHSLVGAALGARWNLPSALCEAIAFHHTPGAAEANARLTATVSLANEVSHFLKDRRPGEDGASPEALLAWSQEALRPLRLSDESLRGLIGACRTELDKGLSVAFS